VQIIFVSVVYVFVHELAEGFVGVQAFEFSIALELQSRKDDSVDEEVGGIAEQGLWFY